MCAENLQSRQHPHHLARPPHAITSGEAARKEQNREVAVGAQPVGAGLAPLTLLALIMIFGGFTVVEGIASTAAIN